MAHIPSRTKSKNGVLSRLSRSDFALLKPHLLPADLPVGTHLETGKTRIDNVYFMEGGFASVVADGRERGIEVGIIGREGMSGLAVVLGTDRSAHDAYIQVAGAGQSISVAKLHWR
jgi:hypothetical protein